MLIYSKPVAIDMFGNTWHTSSTKSSGNYYISDNDTRKVTKPKQEEFISEGEFKI